MNRTVMIHIPKAAGTSMRLLAEQTAPSFQELNRGIKPHNPGASFTCISHRSVPALIRFRWMTQQWWDTSFRFAFVRNTWDRLVSAFRWYQFRRRCSCASNFCLESFDIFIREITSGSKWVPPIGLRITRPNLQHVRPQTDWLKWGVDFIGRFEDLDADWERLCDLVGMPHQPLPRKNTSKRKPYQEYYTEELKGLVADFYAEEIERFQYTFEK